MAISLVPFIASSTFVVRAQPVQTKALTFLSQRLIGDGPSGVAASPAGMVEAG
jgi:hypothetical protein